MDALQSTPHDRSSEHSNFLFLQVGGVEKKEFCCQITYSPFPSFSGIILLIPSTPTLAYSSQKTKTIITGNPSRLSSSGAAHSPSFANSLFLFPQAKE